MTEIRLEGLRKSYGTAAHAVNGLDLAIASGEFITLLGPSGCGKSTTLRMIAGLEEPTAGAILFDGKRVERLAPAARNVAMVFQNYALYPHMTVRGNLDYPLRKRGVAREERDRRIAAVVSVLQLEPLLARRPRQLSGGQQQRVALGRAMIREPQVFLFDEPLSNLDAQLRTGMRAELIRLHRRLKRTMVYVTHDQLEAMTMSDRIAVMRAGDLQQVGAPAEIYAQPANRFVASFVGTPAMNFFDGRLERAEDGATAFVAAGLSLALSQAHEAGDVAMGVRPEHVTIGEGQDRAEVTVVEPTGHETLVILRTAAGDLVARQPGDARVQAGEVVPFAIDASRVHLFDVNTGFRIPTREASRA